MYVSHRIVRHSLYAVIRPIVQRHTSLRFFALPAPAAEIIGLFQHRARLAAVRPHSEPATAASAVVARPTSQTRAR
jgi:hypothetical protein